MNKRREKLARDAQNGGDEAMVQDWPDRSRTSDEQVRAKVSRVHQEYLPVLRELQSRATNSSSMLGLTPAEQKRFDKGRRSGQEAPWKTLILLNRISRCRIRTRGIRSTT